MAYHAETLKLVLFGGVGDGGKRLDDTWTWDGSTWEEEQRPLSPPHGSEASLMAGHEASGRLVLLVAYYAEDNVVTETWTWGGDPPSWRRENPALSPSPYFSRSAMAEHKPSERVLFVRGHHEDSETWTWDGSTWAKHDTDPRPVGPAVTAAYLAAMGEVVTVSGDALRTETWTWNGERWRLRDPSAPPPNSGQLAAHEPSGRVVLLRTPGQFPAGVSEPIPVTRGSAFSETWTWGAPGGADLRPQATVSVRLDPDSVPADSDTEAKITVRVTVAGVPYTGADVKLRTTGDARVDPYALDNSDGTYSAKLVAGSNVGTQIIIARASLTPEQGSEIGSGSAILTQTPTSCPSGTQEARVWTDLDQTFGCGGKVFLSGASDIAVHGDGAVVAGVGLRRLLASGAPDTGFGHGGSVEVTPTAVAVDHQQRIVAIIRPSESREPGVRRYLANGQPDESFAGGQVSKLAFVSTAGKEFVPADVAVQPDGKILVAGTVEAEAALARLTEGGEPDTTFGPSGDGVIVTPYERTPFALAKLALQGGGKAVVAGTQLCILWTPKCFFGVARYNVGVPGKRDGTLDETFNPCDRVAQPNCGGVAITDFGGDSNATARSVDVQPDGKIVVAGEYWNDGRTGFAVARYNVGAPPRQVAGREVPTFDGTLDESLNPCVPTLPPCGGMVVTDDFPGWEYRDRSSSPGRPNGGLGHDVVVQSDGKIVVAGYGPYLSGGDWLVARYQPDGSLDTCGTRGFARTRTGRHAVAHAVVLQPDDGKILVAGSGETKNPVSTIGVIGRYLGGSAPTGDDVSVADAGRVAEPPSGSESAVFEVSLEAPACQAFSVDYETVPGTASAGTDFEGVSNSITFAKGQQRALVAVPVLADEEVEEDETFHVELSNPRPAGEAEPTDTLLGRSPRSAATLKRATATATIVDSGPRAFIGDQTVPDPTAGAAPAAFTVTLSAPATHPVSLGMSPRMVRPPREPTIKPLRAGSASPQARPRRPSPSPSSATRWPSTPRGSSWIWSTPPAWPSAMPGAKARSSTR